MQRTFTINGIILQTNRISEIHRGLVLFTRERGLFRCIAHGALKTKGKLRALTEVFSYIKAYIYHDPVKDSFKLNDAETIELFSSFRKSVKKYYAVNLFAEVILKSFGGGEGTEELYRLFIDVLRYLEHASEQDVLYAVILFGRRFLAIAGFENSEPVCRMCRREIGDSENRYYRRAAHGFVCSQCHHEDGLLIPPGVIRYFEKTDTMKIEDALRIKLAGQTAIGTQTFVYLMVQDVIEKELVTLSPLSELH